jgi:hypothetical protein
MPWPSNVFIDPGPWYAWKADTTWYEPHPTIQDYRLHEKWFPGAPTLATHPDGQSGGVVKDDGKTYPPSMFVEGRPDLEYFGMGVDPPERTYESVGTVATANPFHSDELWAGFDKNANDELDSLGRPLPFVAVFEDEIVALVEEFLWRRRRARWLGRLIPNLDPPRPAWLNEELAKLRSRYSDDRFDVFRRAKPPVNGEPTPNTAAPPEWRVRCSDCHGKVCLTIQ